MSDIVANLKTIKNTKYGEEMRGAIYDSIKTCYEDGKVGNVEITLENKEDIAETVENWLDNHPEATTTVVDGAVTTAKLADKAVTAEKIADDLHDLIVEGNEEIKLTWSSENSGYYVNGYGDKAANGGYKISDTVHLNRDDQITIYAAGTKENVSILSYVAADGAAKPYVSVLKSSSDDSDALKKYEFSITVTADYVISTKKLAGAKLQIEREDAPKRIKEMLDTVVLNVPISIGQTKSYVNTNNAVVSGDNVNYFITQPIQLEAGDVVEIQATSGRYVAILARVVDGNYTYVLRGFKENAPFTYHFLVDISGEYVASFRNSDIDAKITHYKKQRSKDYFDLTEYNFNLFKKVACIGDSVTRGAQNADDYTDYTNASNRDLSYPEVLARRTGVDCRNFGISGATCSSWLSEYKDWGFSSYDCAIIMLGRNFASANDTEEQKVVKIAAQKLAYNELIETLKRDNPHMTIFCLSLPAQYSRESLETSLNTAVQEVATANNLPYVDIYNDTTLASNEWRYKTSSHERSLGYVRLAFIIKNAINTYIENHIEEFRNLWMPNNYPRLMGDISFLTPYTNT